MISRDKVPRWLLGALCVLWTANVLLTPVLWWQIQEGRRAGIRITCATTSAVIDSGRRAITAPSRLPPEFERNLERLGYPTREQREAAARLAARAYGGAIAHAVEVETGVSGLVRKDGSLDCGRFAVAARASR